LRNSLDACHVAIPCRDLDEAQEYYVTRLGCKLARRYPDRITLDFFGDQLVCHLSPADAITAHPTMYPRHFGVTFHDREPFENLLKLVRVREIPFFQEPSVRFEGRAEAHLTFALADPSNNILEFKHYFDPRMMY
jgi:extradiol dioxygenase family protein